GSRITCVALVRSQSDTSKSGHNIRMFFRKILAHQPDIKRWRTQLDQLPRTDQHLAAFLGLAQGRVLRISAINIATSPGRYDIGWRQIDDIDLLGIDLPMLERSQQAVMTGRYKRRGNRLADEILRSLNTRTVTYNQLFAGAQL